MSKNKKQLSTNSQRPNRVVASVPGITERQVGAAAVGKSVVVIDQVKPISTVGTAINVPVKDVKPNPIRGKFAPSIISNKQDRSLDRATVPFTLDDQNELGLISPTENVYAAFNNQSSVVVETALNIKPHFVNEVLMPTTYNTKEVTNIQKLKFIKEYLVKALSETVSTIRQTENFDADFGVVQATISDVWMSNKTVLISTASYFYIPLHGASMPVTALASNLGSGTKSQILNSVTADANFDAIQKLYNKYPAVLDAGTLTGIATCVRDDKLYFFAYQVVTNADGGARLDGITQVMPESLNPVNNYELFSSLQAGANEVTDIAAATPGLTKYSNADIACAKLAVKFRSMAITRNDTINPCYRMPLVKLYALIKHNTLLAAHAQIALNYVRALQELAMSTEPYWPSWYNTFGAIIRSKSEELDAALAALESAIPEIRVHSGLYVDLADAHRITFTNMKTEGSLKVIVPTNPIFPVTCITASILTNSFSEDADQPIGRAGQYMMMHVTANKGITIDQAVNAYTKLHDSLLALSKTLKQDPIVTLNSGTACYSLLGNAFFVPYKGIGTESYALRVLNGKRKLNINAFGHVSYVNVTDDNIYRPFVKKFTYLRSGLTEAVIKAGTPSIWTSTNDTKSYMTIVDQDMGYATGSHGSAFNDHGTTFNHDNKVEYSKCACLDPKLQSLFEVAKTAVNDVDAQVLSLAGVAIYRKWPTCDMYKKDYARVYPDLVNEEFTKAVRKDFELIMTKNSVSSLSNFNYDSPFADYIDYLVNSPDSEFEFETEIEGQYNVVDAPSFRPLRIASFNKPSSMSDITITPVVAIKITDSSAVAAEFANAPAVAKQIKMVKQLLSGFGLNLGSTYVSISYEVANTMPFETPASNWLYTIDESEYLDCAAISGTHRAYNAGSYDTMKLEYAAQYSTKYVL